MLYVEKNPSRGDAESNKCLVSKIETPAETPRGLLSILPALMLSTIAFVPPKSMATNTTSEWLDLDGPNRPTDIIVSTYTRNRWDSLTSIPGKIFRR